MKWIYPRKFAFALICIAFSLFSTSVMRAQQSSTISGSISDTMGTGIPHSTIVFRNEATNAVVKIEGDDQGHFVSPSLPAGKYSVEASAPNFALTTKKGVEVAAGSVPQVA